MMHQKLLILALAVTSLLAASPQAFSIFGFGTSSGEGDTTAVTVDPRSIATLSLPMTKQEDAYLQEKYGFLKSVAKEPGRYSECWGKATAILDTWCHEMDNDTKQRVALSLASCHLKDGK